MFGTNVCHVYVHCCSLNTSSSKWTRKINAGSICDSQIGKLSRFLRVCPGGCSGSGLILALGREHTPWPGSIRQVTLHSSPSAFRGRGSHCLGRWGRMARVGTYKSLLRCGLFALIETANRLKEIGMNTGRARWDRRIEKGASRSVVSSGGLAHKAHRDNQDATDCLREETVKTRTIRMIRR